jgi:hypothetical protein
VRECRDTKWCQGCQHPAAERSAPVLANPHFGDFSLTALEQDSMILAMIEMSQSKWLVAALVPGVERHPLLMPGRRGCSMELRSAGGGDARTRVLRALAHGACYVEANA